ncbi:hypothetical protein ES708_10203 [subsurface metagenome]
MVQAKVVVIAPEKIQQIMAAGQEQLSPEEFEKLCDLLVDLSVYGLTPWINTELGKLMAKFQWELEVEVSPKWEEALIACDRAYLGRELKEMCAEVFLSPDGHKKQLCARLYEAGVPEVVEIMEPLLGKGEPEQAPRLFPQTKYIYQSELRQVKDRLEELYRTNPDEFYHRKHLVEKAIEERQKGKAKTMLQFTLEELQEILNSANRLYR